MPDNQKKQVLWAGIGCLLGTAAVYGLTLAPTVQGFDSAELTVGAYTLGLVHPTGYPLYMLIGHGAAQLPWGSVGFRLNLLSAILGVISITSFFFLLSAQSKSLFTALTTAALFALAPQVWAQSIKAEVYTLHIFLVVSILGTWVVAEHNRQPKLALLYFALLGLASANHATSTLLGLGLLAGTRWKDARWRNYSIAGIILGACLVLLLYSYFPWRAGQPGSINYIGEYFGRDPRQLADLLWLVSGQAFRCAVQPAWSLSGILEQVVRLGTFIWDGSLGLAPLLAIWGWKELHHSAPRWNRLLSVYFLANLVFFFIYQVVDKEAMFLPIYLIMDLWIAQGIVGFTRWLPAHLPRLNPARANLLTNLVLMSLLGFGLILDWHAIDLSQDRRASNYASQILQVLPPGTVLVNHWATASVFDYLRIVEGLRPDVRSFNLDFFFLGTQSACESSGESDAHTAWFNWIEAQNKNQTPLCFIEPLPSKPDSFQWLKQDVCWTLGSSP